MILDQDGIGLPLGKGYLKDELREDPIESLWRQVATSNFCSEISKMNVLMALFASLFERKTSSF